MTDLAGLTRLFSWLSPSFPIGGFAYSQGLETAIVRGEVRDGETLYAWIAGQLHRGGMRNDAMFLSIAARAVRDDDRAGYMHAAGFCLALQFSAERDKETREQARSFIISAAAWPASIPDWLDASLAAPIALPIAFGALASVHGVPILPAVSGFLNAATAQQISVGVRLIPLGQSTGLAVQARLERDITALAEAVQDAGLDDVAALSPGADIASLVHEDLNVRIFRS